MGKMISPQNLAVAAAAVGMITRRATSSARSSCGASACWPTSRCSSSCKPRPCRLDGPGGAPVTATLTPEALATLLRGCVADGAQVRTSELDRRALAHDASHFLLTPQAVVAPRDAAEVGRLLRGQPRPRACRSRSAPAAPACPGRRSPTAILVDTRRHFRGIEVLDDGARVRVQPGVTVRQVNARLAALRPQARPRPGQRGRLHASAASSPTTPAAWPAAPWPTATARWSPLVARAARPARSSTPAPPTPTRGCARSSPSCYAGPAAAAATGSRGDPASVREDRAAVLDEEHDGLRPQLVPRPHPPRRRSSPTCGRQRGHARRSSPRSSMRTVPLLQPRQHRAAGLRRPLRGHRRAARAGRHRRRRPSS